MSGKFSGYIIRESRLYTERLQEIGDATKINIALNAVWFGLANNPESFPIVPMATPGNPLRVVKTDLHISDEVVVPPLRIFFSIEEGNVVLLRNIETRHGFGF